MKAGAILDPREGRHAGRDRVRMAAAEIGGPHEKVSGHSQGSAAMPRRRGGRPSQPWAVSAPRSPPASTPEAGWPSCPTSSAVAATSASSWMTPARNRNTRSRTSTSPNGCHACPGKRPSSARSRAWASLWRRSGSSSPCRPTRRLIRQAGVRRTGSASRRGTESRRPPTPLITADRRRTIYCITELPSCSRKHTPLSLRNRQGGNPGSCRMLPVRLRSHKDRWSAGWPFSAIVGRPHKENLRQHRRVKQSGFARGTSVSSGGVRDLGVLSRVAAPSLQRMQKLPFVNEAQRWSVSASSDYERGLPLAWGLPSLEPAAPFSWPLEPSQAQPQTRQWQLRLKLSPTEEATPPKRETLFTGYPQIYEQANPMQSFVKPPISPGLPSFFDIIMVSNRFILGSRLR